MISLDYFCGFIDVQNALQSHTIWTIHVWPNVHVHFLKFSLFTNYWYCDFEYLRVISKSSRSTFCGDRLPWIYDASEVSVSIILSTQRFGFAHYQIELQYYGAHMSNYQHFVIFTEPSSGIFFHLPNVVKKNEFESFHFISNGRLNIMHLAAVNMCGKWQIICHDGPGMKSPTIRFKYYNQSEWKCLSSAFQMFCKILAPDLGCSEVPRSYYHAVRAKDEDFTSLIGLNISDYFTYFKLRLQINDTQNSGTTKYMFNNTAPIYSHNLGVQIEFAIRVNNISFPYKLYEGYSCMYGGIYIINSSSSSQSEVLSHCTPISTMNKLIIPRQDFSVVIIHYSEYSSHIIFLDA